MAGGGGGYLGGAAAHSVEARSCPRITKVGAACRRFQDQAAPVAGWQVRLPWKVSCTWEHGATTTKRRQQHESTKRCPRKEHRCGDTRRIAQRQEQDLERRVSPTKLDRRVPQQLEQKRFGLNIGSEVI